MRGFDDIQDEGNHSADSRASSSSSPLHVDEDIHSDGSTPASFEDSDGDLADVAEVDTDVDDVPSDSDNDMVFEEDKDTPTDPFNPTIVARQPALNPGIVNHKVNPKKRKDASSTDQNLKKKKKHNGTSGMTVTLARRRTGNPDMTVTVKSAFVRHWSAVPFAGAWTLDVHMTSPKLWSEKGLTMPKVWHAGPYHYPGSVVKLAKSGCIGREKAFQAEINRMLNEVDGPKHTGCVFLVESFDGARHLCSSDDMPATPYEVTFSGKATTVLVVNEREIALEGVEGEPSHIFRAVPHFRDPTCPLTNAKGHLVKSSTKSRLFGVYKVKMARVRHVAYMLENHEGCYGIATGEKGSVYYAHIPLNRAKYVVGRAAASPDNLCLADATITTFQDGLCPPSMTEAIKKIKKWSTLVSARKHIQDAIDASNANGQPCHTSFATVQLFSRHGQTLREILKRKADNGYIIFLLDDGKCHVHLVRKSGTTCDNDTPLSAEVS